MSTTAPFAAPFIFPSTTLIVSNNTNLGSGTFEIRESEIAWTPNTPSTSCPARVVDFKSVSLSAVATWEDRACLYLQIDGDGRVDTCMVNGAGGHGEDEERDEDGDPLEALSEMFLLFDCEEDLRKAFEAMCEGALRNPDSDDEGDDQAEMGMGGWFTAGSLAEGLAHNMGLEDGDDEEDIDGGHGDAHDRA